jgi:lysophospholipase L1-like esterase
MKPPQPPGKTCLRFGEKGCVERPAWTIGQTPNFWSSPKHWEAIQILKLTTQVIGERDSRTLAAKHEQNSISHHKRVSSSQPIQYGIKLSLLNGITNTASPSLSEPNPAMPADGVHPNRDQHSLTRQRLKLADERSRQQPLSLTRK